MSITNGIIVGPFSLTLPSAGHVLSAHARYWPDRQQNYSGALISSSFEQMDTDAKCTHGMCSLDLPKQYRG